MTEPVRERLRDLAAAYALGALDADETRAFQAELGSFPELQREVAEYREVAALLALEAPPAAPSETLKQRLLARIAKERRRVPRRRWIEGLAWAAAVVGLVASGALLLRSRGFQREIDALQAELDAARVDLARRNEILKTILAPGTVTFTLSSSAEPQPSVQVFWDRSANLWVLSASNLRPAPAGRAYQLWFLQDGRAVPSVTFNSEPGGAALLRAPGPETVAGLTGAAISEEPAGGSPQPTSAPILIGQLRP